MPKLKHELTEEIIAQIEQSIEQGAFEDVAVEAVGIPLNVYEKWLIQGRKSKCHNPLYQELVRRITKAKAIARLNAETSVLMNDPKFWLLNGPGKGDGTTDWTKPRQAPKIQHNNQTINVTGNPQIASILNMILEVLAPYPEAKAAIAKAFKGSMPHRDYSPVGTWSHLTAR